MLLFLSLWPLVSLCHCSLDSGNKENSTLIIKSWAFSFVITLVLMAFCHTPNYIMFHCPARHKVTGERCPKCLSTAVRVREINDLSEMRSEISGKERSFTDGNSQLWQRLTMLKLSISKLFSFSTFVLEVINIAIFSSNLCYSYCCRRTDTEGRCYWGAQQDSCCSCSLNALCPWPPKRQWSWLMPTFSLKETMRDWETPMKKVLMKTESDMEESCVLLYCFAVTFSTNIHES